MDTADDTSQHPPHPGSLQLLRRISGGSGVPIWRRLPGDGLEHLPVGTPVIPVRPAAGVITVQGKGQLPTGEIVLPTGEIVMCYQHHLCPAPPPDDAP